MLTEKQRRFVNAYTGPGSGERAARVAGYQGSSNALRVAASKLLRVPAVANAIESGTASRSTLSTSTLTTTFGPGVATMQDAMCILSDIARDREAPARARIDAAIALIKMRPEERLPAKARAPIVVVEDNERGPGSRPYGPEESGE